MLELYSGQNLLTTTLRALVDGDVDFFFRKRAPGPKVMPLLAILKTLKVIRDAGMATEDKLGRVTVEHPVLGTIQWAHTTHVMSCDDSAEIIVNAASILKTRLTDDGVKANWVAPAAQRIPDEMRAEVENILGCIADAETYDSPG